MTRRGAQLVAALQGVAKRFAGYPLGGVHRVHIGTVTRGDKDLKERELAWDADAGKLTYAGKELPELSVTDLVLVANHIEALYALMRKRIDDNDVLDREAVAALGHIKKLEQFWDARETGVTPSQVAP